MRCLKTLSITGVMLCAVSCRSGAPVIPLSSHPAGGGSSLVVFPFIGGGAFPDRFYELAAGEQWTGLVVPRAVVAGEMKKLGVAPGGRLTGKQAQTIAGRLGANIAISGREESGGRVYVYVADLEARVAFVMRRYLGDSAGVKAFMDDIRRYAGLSAHERETLAKVRFREASKTPAVPAAAEADPQHMPSSPVPMTPGDGSGTGETADIPAPGNVTVDISELDAIRMDDLDLGEINMDDMGF